MIPNEDHPVVMEVGRLPAYAAPPLYSSYAVSGPYAEEDPEESKIPLSQYLWILKRWRFRIVGFVAATVLATWVISARLSPIFESTATVDIDRQSPPGVVGDDAARTVLND